MIFFEYTLILIVVIGNQMLFRFEFKPTISMLFQGGSFDVQSKCVDF